MFFWGELKRRKIYRVATAYAITAWAMIEVGSATFGPLHIPERVLTFLIVFLIVGFPITLGITWLFEIGGKVRKTSSANESTTPTRVITYSTRKRLFLVFAGVLIAGVLTLLFSQFTGWGRIPDNKTIAVIPFKLIGDDQEGKYFAEGVADALINHLHTISNLKVRSRTSAEKYAGSLKTITEIGSELDAQYILEGSAQKYKNKIRIIVQLINAQTDDNVWFKEYNENFDDIFRIQSEIALNIASELNVRLAGSEKARLERKPTNDPEAWDLYLKGMEYTRNAYKYQDQTNPKIANDFFKRAIQRDPNFALAYTRLANISWSLPKDSVILLIKKAIDLDPTLADSYDQLGFIYKDQRKFEEARLNFQKAIDLDPLQNFFLSLGRNYSDQKDYLKALSIYSDAFKKEKSDSYQWLLYETALSYTCVGEFGVADRFLDAAFKIEPDNIVFLYLREQLQSLEGNLDGMVESAKRSVAIRGADWTLRQLANAYFLKGDYKETAKVYSHFFSTDDHPHHVHAKMQYAFILKKFGKEKEALDIVNAVVQFLKINPEYDVDYNLAKVAAFSGERAKALDHLEKLKVDLWLMGWIGKDPVFETLRDEPRFKALVSRFDLELNVRKKEAESKRASGEFPNLAGY